MCEPSINERRSADGRAAELARARWLCFPERLPNPIDLEQNNYNPIVSANLCVVGERSGFAEVLLDWICEEKDHSHVLCAALNGSSL